MRIALLGGTFNPVHNGHILLADKVRINFNYDKIIFVPSFIPAHKHVSDEIIPEERLEMLIGALEDLTWADFSDCEIRRKGVSYTADTLEYIQDFYQLTEKPGLIIGDDLATGFHSWRNPGKIISLADLIIAHRLSEKEIPLPFPHRYIDNEIFTLSSSEIRSMVGKGMDISAYVPEKVHRYIREKRFYRGVTRRN